MDIQERAKALNETRAKVWHEQEAFLSELTGTEMNEEQRAQNDRYNARIDGIQNEINDMGDVHTRETEAAAVREAQSAVFGAEPDDVNERRSTEQALRAWIRGDERRQAVDYDGRSVNGYVANIEAVARERAAVRMGASPEEVRALAWDTGSVASAVPTLFDRSLYEVLEANIAGLRMPTTRISSDSGAPMDFTKVVTHSIATQVAGQGTTLAGTDPTFGKLSLTPVKFGELVRIGSEVVSDAGVDIVSFVTRDIGRAVGRRVNQQIVTAMMAGALTGSAGTVSTGGSLIDPGYNTLIDMEYGVADAYRSNSAAWLTRDKTAGVLRKLRDGAGGTEGAPLWQPNLTNGIAGYRQPDALNGYPVFTDPNVASLASNARVMAFADWSAFYFRTVGNPMVERSDEAGFTTDEVLFRGKWRSAGGWIDDSAGVLLKRSV